MLRRQVSDIETSQTSMSEAPLRINPLDLSFQTDLNDLLRNNRAVAVFKAGQDYSLADNRVASLTNTLVVRNILDCSQALCYFVLANNIYPEGAFSKVYDLKGVITYQADSRKFSYQILPGELGDWVVKEFGNTHSLWKRSGLCFPLSAVERESALARRCLHLKSSPLLGGDKRRYIIMKKFADKELGEVINDYWHGGNSTYKLTLIDRVELCILLTVAIQTQIHDYDLVHCDLKPENILIDTSTKPFTVNIIDVGLAKKNGTKCLDKFQGTLAYMPPECRHSRDAITFKSDVYSLGCIFYVLFGFLQRVDKNQINCDLTTGLNLEVRKKLLSVLRYMVTESVNERPKLDTVQGFFIKLHAHLTNEPLCLSIPSQDYTQTPYNFFAPQFFTEPSKLTSNQFQLLLNKSITSYEMVRGSKINSTYFEMLKECRCLETFVQKMVETKANESEPLNGKSLICFFMEEAKIENLLDSIRHELMLDEIHTHLLVWDDRGDFNTCLFGSMYYSEKTIAELEREKLWSQLVRFADYTKGDVLRSNRPIAS